MSDLDAVYAERDKLVAFLSRCYPSFLAPAPDAVAGFTWIVYVETHEGQLSWHVHDDELSWFAHLPRRETGEWWDGHATDEKYARLARLRPADEPKTTNPAAPRDGEPTEEGAEPWTGE
jgi:hypothetical protein